MCLTAGQKAEVNALAFGGLGAVIGGVIGKLVHRTFIIQNNKEKFDEFKWKLMR
jgi:hypothetical protein